ncbi:MAG: hypothetical protein NC131_15080 [Roseburia sp.]|nr:hypothetical protein [Roseburia sp.]
MATLYDVLPSQKPEKIPKTHQAVQTLDKIHDFVDTGSKLFSGIFSYDSKSNELTEMVAKKESNLIKSIWDEFEYVPENYSSPSVQSKAINPFPAKALSSYPTTLVSKIVNLADVLDMVLLPLDFVDIDGILEAHGYDKWSSLASAIKEAKNVVKKIEGQLYIICPVSYYSFWNEITSDERIEKYYPERFESVFTTIDLMIPSQKNLYKMIQTNSENIKTVQEDMKDNIAQINAKLNKISQRITNIETQMEQIKIEMERQAEENRKMARRLQEIELERQRYMYLDPLIFFTTKRIKSFETIADNIIAHVVACFGPEFPVEFFSLNNLTIFKHPSTEKEIVFGKKKKVIPSKPTRKLVSDPYSNNNYYQQQNGSPNPAFNMLSVFYNNF